MVWVNSRPPVRRLSTMRWKTLQRAPAVGPTRMHGTVNIEHECLQLVIRPGSVADRGLSLGDPAAIVGR
ncbi:hypothetical protein SAMN05216360_10784 [Methylobacterium phyllostachyos]|uniref:Uncharacterized protein n=1 Tax=Methylobacterium phyllostachyos TaxID=582672 RepID=A0A1H0A698_9HYPH|nr:hypothetical protein SAMN05216360_10784 [Methylobacterium phyllostachyos]